MMVAPTDVTTRGVEVKEIIRDTGPDGWAVAKIKDGHQIQYGIRWNGSENTNGYPTARGYPVWFTLPDEVAVIIEAHYRARDME